MDNRRTCDIILRLLNPAECAMQSLTFHEYLP